MALQSNIVNRLNTSDVTASAVIADNVVVRGDGGARGVQGSGITIDDSNNVTGVVALSASGILTTSSGLVKKVRVVIAAGAVTVATTDWLVVVNKTVGAATVVNLPATPTTGTEFVIKDGKGDANSNNLTVTPAAGNIDGSGTFVMNVNYQSATFVYNGSSWSIT